MSEPPGPQSPGPQSPGQQSVAPQSVAPQSVGPQSVGPQSVAPYSVAPQSVGPERPGAWVGRATPRPVDPYWPPVETTAYPPLEPAIYHPPPGVPAAGVVVPAGYVLVPERPRRRRGLRTVLILAGVLAACCAGGGTFALVSSAALHGGGTRAAAPPGLNTPVRDGKFQFVVTAVSCGHESVSAGFVNKQAQGQFCVVDLTVQNIGTKGQLLLDGVQKAFGPDGTEYGTDSGAGVIANASTSVWVNMINPGNSVAGKIVFDLPKGASIAKLELHDSVLSSGATVTLS